MDIMTTLRTQWDRTLAVVAAIGGFVCLLLGYFGVSGTGFVAEQLPYVVGDGLIGLFLLGAAATLWLSADLRDEWRKLDMIDDKLARAFGDGDAAAAPAAGALVEEPPTADIAVAAAPRARRSPAKATATRAPARTSRARSAER